MTNSRVVDVMNDELFCVFPDAEADGVGACLRGFGIRAAVVVDPDGRPVGVLTRSDIQQRRGDGSRAGDRMTRPPVTIPEVASVQLAARRMSDEVVHHLVAVGDDGEAVGCVSALDVIRALMGATDPRWSSFPAYRDVAGTGWPGEAREQS